MKTLYTFLLLLVFPLLSCTKATQQDHSPSKPAQLASIPDNPCKVLSPERVAAITGLEVASANRVPSLDKVVQAQRENHEPGPGTICLYETRSDFGAVLIAVPAHAERSADEYWKTRAKYFETFPGAARPVAGLGKDAWLSGGTTLHVLTHGDEHFTLSTQMHQPRSRELLVNIAQGVLGQL
jgi:hypothetical protein